MIACLTHWYTSLLYVAPVLLIAGVLGIQHVRDRHRDRREESTDASAVERISAPV